MSFSTVAFPRFNLRSLILLLIRLIDHRMTKQSLNLRFDKM